MFGYLVGGLVGWLWFGWLVSCLVGWWVGWLVKRLIQYLVSDNLVGKMYVHTQT